MQAEDNEYFPPESITLDCLKASTTHTKCSWNGIASYFYLKMDGEVNKEAVWYYPDLSKAASEIKDQIAFWKGMEVYNT